MKRILFSMLAMLIVFVLVTPAHAILINRGTDTAGNRLIYDQDLDITWYDFSNAGDTWYNQVAWASGLSVTFEGDTYDDWRLPTKEDTGAEGFVGGSTDPSFYDGTGPNGFNITTSEMGHLFYTELGNLGYYDTSGSWPQLGYGLNITGDFQNLVSGSYYSGEVVFYPGFVWNFDFGTGSHNAGGKSANWYALAVRSGDVVAAEVVPEPATIALLGIGLVGLAGGAVRRRLRKNKP